MAKPIQNGSSIIDNRERGSVGEYLRKHISANSALSFVSAYFTIYAFNQLEDELGKVKGLRFLFGEPSFLKQIDPERTDKKAFDIEDSGLRLRNRLQQNKVAKECAEWIRDKVEVRSVIYPNFLHGKLYHIDTDGVDHAIVGSSNFTVNGLGLGDKRNVELNLIVDSRRDQEDLKAWFEELWSNSELVEDVKDEVLKYLGEIYADYSPEFIYKKTLYHIFEGILDEEAEAERRQTQQMLAQTQIWQKLYEFQKVAVKHAISKIQKHNGCIIADSVGLGKTFEALAVMKYYELRNQNVLVLCPKRLRENWTVFQSHAGNLLNPFPDDRFNFTVLSHTDLSREGGHSGAVDLNNFHWGNYDLVVIDESHNFRNNTPNRKDEEGNIIRKSRYSRLIEDIITTGRKTKVLMLSATPVNTDLRDLRNQLYLLSDAKDDAFAESIGIRSLKESLGVAQRQFNEWASDKKRDGHDRRSLMMRLDPAFFKLLDELSIARSRKHVENYYADSMSEIGKFPDRNKPESIYPDIDTLGRFMSYDKLNEEISNYKLAVFNPAKYVRREHRGKYFSKEVVANFNQEQRESHLIGMMKIGFLKRLESSINSFAITLDRTLKKIEDLEDRIELFKENQQMALFDFEAPDMQTDDEELEAAFQIGKKLQYDLRHLDIDLWLKELGEDKQQIDLIMTQALTITADRDAKLQNLKEIIRKKVEKPAPNRAGKPVKKNLVFTAFSDTAEYLFDALKDWAKDELGIHVALVTGGGGGRTTLGRPYFNEVLTNFSPISKSRERLKSLPQDEEIDLLIATDCISEGQNLQDCDQVINYDIHWNPVRLIQRFGRIDRLGSQNDAISLVNFWPTKDLNKYLNLENRVKARMALVDVTSTGNDNILAPKELPDAEQTEKLAEDELTYRDKQLLRLKDEILDLEDFNETIALNEFSLDDFRAELSEQMESEREKLAAAPFGINAVTYRTEELPPGVIFCLRQNSILERSETVNPLQPFYLVYVRDDGKILMNFVQVKQLLEAFKALSLGYSTPIEQLCRIFNEETNNGENMEGYTDLLDKSIADIKHSFGKRNQANLFTSRSGKLVAAKDELFDSENFTLVTWLVIAQLMS